MRTQSNFGRRQTYTEARARSRQSAPHPHAAQEQVIEEHVSRTHRVKDQDEKFCKDCAAIINVNAEICPACGVRQMGSLYQPAGGRKNRVTAILLALCLGGLGAHKFYLGQPALGVIYLLFVWTFIPALIAFAEMLMYLTMSDEEFARRYG